MSEEEPVALVSRKHLKEIVKQTVEEALEQKGAEEPKKKEKELEKYAKPYKKRYAYGARLIGITLKMIKETGLPDTASVDELIEKLKEIPEEKLEKLASELFEPTAAIRDEATGEIIGFRKDMVDGLLSELLLEGAITSEMYSDVRRILDAPETTGESVIAALPMEEQAYLMERQRRINAAIELLKKKPEKPKAKALFYE